MRVALACSEAVLFAKTGGLADMVGSLATSLSAQGGETTLILPAYRSILALELERTRLGFDIPVGESSHHAEILEGGADDRTVAYFVRADEYFDREGVSASDPTTWWLAEWRQLQRMEPEP